MRKQLWPAILLLGTLVLAACAPTVVSPDTPRPLVTVINAPTETRQSFLAEDLEEAVERVGTRETYTFMRPGPIRFQETHRDMGRSRAIPSASSLARNLTADLAILVAAPVFEREVEVEGNYQYLDYRVQVEVLFVDPHAEQQLAAFTSREYTGHRRLPVQVDLPALDEDPDLRQLADHALANVAPAVAGQLDELAAQYRNMVQPAGQ